MGLVALLLVTIGLIAYVLWPPSAKTLYGKAERLMASESSTDWREADREILGELDRRFPKLYVEQKKEWRVDRDRYGKKASLDPGKTQPRQTERAETRSGDNIRHGV